ncbi:Signal transduction histidine-protein kinase ArlS [Rubrobacter xylanophilus DSM 9941]|uniref:sensor histidine kinase n=1 Tax=Rubrobacter xylanophilus TaxID=49319 RepID=UPI001F1A42E6|nr:HAMP domain-containing sensor histidine kinase [Rubrobacter xylanophilus]QYJ16055.1 Signal transduction histidine-protein kinase ArlS [Rubrobacter xylanophilus DSM 9941]
MPILWRLTLFNTLAIGLILLAVGLGLFFLLRGLLLSDLRQTVTERALAAAAEIREVDDEDEAIDSEDIEDLTLDGVFILVRDREGDVIFQTVSLASSPENDPLWRRALEEGRTVSGTVALSPEAPDHVVAVPVSTPENPARVVEAGMSREPVAEALAAFRTALLIGLAAGLALSAAGSYLLARLALSPVDAVVRAAGRIEATDLSGRLPVVNPQDEIGRLASTINSLLARTETAFRQQREALDRQRRFAADASHELRTPLTSIAGYARMLEDWALEDPATARESAAAIRREAERMRHLVEELLALARGDEGRPLELRRGDLAAVAGESAAAARAAAGGRVSVVWEPPEAPVEAVFDRERVRQALAALLDNAVQYTPEGGEVRVRAFRRDGRVAVRVEDTGPGIPEEQLGMIFERFHRADPVRRAGGAGLGLSIARQIAQAHNGTIEVRSTPGKGSVFTLLLPADGPRKL